MESPRLVRDGQLHMAVNELRNHDLDEEEFNRQVGIVADFAEKNDLTPEEMNSIFEEIAASLAEVQTQSVDA